MSDTIENDLKHTIKTVENATKENIEEEDQNKFLSALSKLNNMFDKEKSQAEIIPDFIWNMPTAYEDIACKKEIYMNSETLLIIKGDLNYIGRRDPVAEYIMIQSFPHRFDKKIMSR